jgi:ribonucleoside-diphosphate reductase alpha chain
MIPDSEPEEEALSQNHLAQLAEEVARRLNQVSGQGGNFGGGTSGGGIAPEAKVATPSGTSFGSGIAEAMASGQYGSLPGLTPEKIAASGVPPLHGLRLADRGIYHAADAMREMYEMGDSPSCSVCGAIMTRNGSCYRCMECGSTSGCS